MFQVTGIPAGSTLEITCAHGPKAARRTVKRNANAIKIKPLVRTHKAGTAIVVRVSKPGMVTTVRTLKLRAGKNPTVTVGCIAPGAKKATACA